jgi:putative radical SAM enzyme (TIGR03279 family)
MTLPTVVAVEPRSAAARAGLQPGDQILTVAGQAPRDVIEYRLLADDPDVELELRRGGLEITLTVAKDAGEPLGAQVSSPVFDRVHTCDNHCAFCFIYQLPKALRPSLYVKDDDYRLSFLYGNFTTLTRFTEADLERVVTERLSPLHVSIHATDPEVRAAMLRNRRGATSLRWLRALLDAEITVHGQIVVCPGVNDGPVLEDTLCGILDRYPELASVAAVPLGVSRFSGEPSMRPHTLEEANAVLDTVDDWQRVFAGALGRRLVFAADEYYVLTGRPLPPAATYEGFPQHENGVGMAQAFAAGFSDGNDVGSPDQRGFFAAIDGAPPVGYRAPRWTGPAEPGDDGDRNAPIAIVTGEYGAAVLGPLVDRLGRRDVRVLAVPNEFFGGNIGVTGLLVGADVARSLAGQPTGERYLLPDVCLSHGLFLDGMAVTDLPRPVEVVPTDGRSLRRALEGPTVASAAGAEQA